jgi:O-antigen/teichoic acid export membrane protein
MNGVSNDAVRAPFGTLRRFVRSDIARHGLVTFSATMGANAFNYLFHLATIRRLGVEEYGVVSATIAGIAVIGIPGAIVQQVLVKVSSELYAAGSLDRVRALADRVLGIMLIAAAVALAAGLLCRHAIAAYLALDRTDVIAIGLGIFAVGLITPGLRGVLQGVHDFASFSASLWIEGAVKTICGVGLVYLGFRAEGALAGMLLATACAAMFSLWRIRRDVAVPPSELHLDLRRLVVTMVGVTLTTAAVTLLTYMDVILVKHYFSPETAGIYSAVALIGKTILFFVGFVPLVVLPHVTSRAAAGLPTRGILVQAGVVLVAILAVSLGAFALVPGTIVALAAGSHYAAGIPYLFGYGVAMALLGCTSFATAYRIGLHRFGFVVPLVVVAAGEALGIMFHHGSIREVIGVMTAGNLCALVVVIVTPNPGRRAATPQPA